MEMKLKINRETAIGLSVLLVLLVILGVVFARRLFHREAIVAMEEEKHIEEPRDDRAPRVGMARETRVSGGHGGSRSYSPFG